MKRLLITALLLTACGANEPPKAQDQSASTQDSAIYNFHEVEPGLYRSGELTPASISVLANKYHIKTIVSVDSYTFNSSGKHAEINTAMKYGISFVWMPLHPMGDLDVPKVLAIEKELEILPRPILFHCYRGSERTGIVAAAYRILHGWNYTKAFAEADLYGFSSWYNEWKRDLLHEIRPQIP